MWPWKKTKRKYPHAAARFGQQLNTKIVAAQRKVADALNRRTFHWSRRQKVIFLFGACALLITANLLMLQVDTSVTESIHAPSPRSPVAWLRSPFSAPLYSSHDTAVFLELRQRLDSLIATDSGRRQIQAFEAQRPGFLDSVLYIERQILPTLPPINISSIIKPSIHERETAVQPR